MTQPPLPPQMPPEPLDEAERAIARALRNLSAGAPPPELDARILGAARRAVHLSPPRKRNNQRWIVGIGTAASALLAIGLFVKSHPGQDAVYTPPAETESAAPAAATAAKEQAEPQATADEMAPAGNVAAAQSGIPAEAKPPLDSMSTPQTAGSLSGTAAKSAPQAFPSVNEPPPPPQPVRSPPPRVLPLPVTPPVVLEESAPMAAPAPPASPPAPPPPPKQAVDERAERKVEQDSYSARRDAAGSVAAPASDVATGGAALDQPALGKAASNALKSNAAVSDQAASDTANAAEASKDKSLDRVEVTGGNRTKRANDAGAAMPSIDDDAKLSSSQWIERIRARVDAADGDGARESLRRYRLRYPHARIPDDLLPLLQ